MRRQNNRSRQKSTTVQAKEIAQAIEQGLRKLKCRREDVEIEVVQNPRKGFLGIGARDAVVKLRRKMWSTEELDAQIYMDVPKRRGKGGRRGNGKVHGERSNRGGRRVERMEAGEVREKTPKANEPQLLPCDAIRNAVIPENLKGPMEEAKTYLQDVLTHMGVKVENLNAWWDEKQQRILLTFDCDSPAIVIGKEGKTLEAIQYLSTLALSRHFDTPISVVTDTQNYWRKTEDKINAEIEKGIDLIRHGHSVFRFRPMGAQLRRYIHRAVEGNEYVTTASEGEGKWRKVTFRPTEKTIAELDAHKAPVDFVPGVIGEDIPAEQPAITEQEAAQPATVEEPKAEQPSCTEQPAANPAEQVGVASPVVQQKVEMQFTQTVMVSNKKGTTVETVTAAATSPTEDGSVKVQEDAEITLHEPLCGPLFEEVNKENTENK